MADSKASSRMAEDHIPVSAEIKMNFQDRNTQAWVKENDTAKNRSGGEHTSKKQK